MKPCRNWSVKLSKKRNVLLKTNEGMRSYDHALVHAFPRETSIFVSEQENSPIVVTSIIHLNLFIAKYVKSNALHLLLLMLAGLEKRVHFTY